MGLNFDLYINEEQRIMRQKRRRKRSYKRVKWILGIMLTVLVAVAGIMAANHSRNNGGLVNSDGEPVKSDQITPDYPCDAVGR